MEIFPNMVAVLDDGHPYLAQFPVTVDAYRSGWRVTWIDFQTVKQEFYSEDKAKVDEVCKWVNRYRHIVEADCITDTFEACDAMWPR